MKICPLLSANTAHERFCLGAECAWYSDSTKECAFKTIAEDGGYVYPATEEAWDAVTDDETDMMDRVCDTEVGAPPYYRTPEEFAAAVEEFKQTHGLRFGETGE